MIFFMDRIIEDKYYKFFNISVVTLNKFEYWAIEWFFLMRLLIVRKKLNILSLKLIFTSQIESMCEKQTTPTSMTVNFLI